MSQPMYFYIRIKSDKISTWASLEAGHSGKLCVYFSNMECERGWDYFDGFMVIFVTLGIVILFAVGTHARMSVSPQALVELGSQESDEASIFCHCKILPAWFFYRFN